MAEPLYAEALLVRRSKIVFCGDLKTAESMAEEGAERVDLKGRTLMPRCV